MRGQRRVRVGQIGELDAADQQCAEFTVARRGQDADGVAARARRAGRRRARRRRSVRGPTRRRRVGHRAAGSGSAPASSAPRSPARRGIQASRAPVAVGQSCSPPRAHRATLASRSPTRMIAPGSLSRSSSASAVERRGLAAGRRRDQPAAPSWSGRGWRTGATDDHLQAVLADGLAQPQEDDRRLLFGLEARPAAPRAPSPGRRRSPSSAGPRRARPGTRPPPRCAARARKSMSLVPNTIRANFE